MEKTLEWDSMLSSCGSEQVIFWWKRNTKFKVWFVRPVSDIHYGV